MESPNFCSTNSTIDSEVDLKLIRPFCCCCFSTEKRVLNAIKYEDGFHELAGISMSQYNVLAQWICYECTTSLQKAVRFKNQILKAQRILCEYLAKCIPLPLTEGSSNLTKTEVLCFNGSGKKLGYHTVLTHSTKTRSVMQLLEAAEMNCEIKLEEHFDYEDDMTLDQVKSIERHGESVSIVKTKHCKKLENIQNKGSNEDSTDDDGSEKTPDSKIVVLDPKKIMVVTLTEEEQSKQREEDKAAGLKFPFQCKMCFKGFNYNSKLDSHMEKHNPTHGRFECQVCHIYLSTPYNYGLHTQTHTKRYQCVRCGRRMINRASIVEHYRTQHEGVIYVCNICRKVFSNFKTHQGHMRNHHSGDRPKCDECGKTFVNKNSLTEHKRIHEGVKNFACTACDMKFLTISQLRHHLNKHSDVSKDTRDYYCVECDERFKSIHNLRKHLQKSLKHQDEKSLQFPCPHCSRRFVSSSSVSSHVLVQHEGVRAHRCLTCGAGLASRSSLHKHQLAVHGGRRQERRHVCDTCGRAFRSKNVLMNHIRTHTGEKPFVCGECGRGFAQHTTMQTHYKLVHLKIRRREKMKPESRVAEEPKIEIA